MNSTHARIKQLHRIGANDQNLLKDLHDYIYKWTESIPLGGHRIDISDKLRTIYDNYMAKLATQQKLAEKTKHVESIDSYLDEDDYDFFDDDDEYDDDF